MSFAIIAIGNPGVGKSTILNSIAGQVLFKSGTSYGSGLTYQLDEKENAKGKFIDTPGLADDKYREAAGKAISTVLKRGGPYKILFFVSEYSGRVVQQDVATMRLVLEAASEISNKYGIVINQVSKKVMQGVESNAENCKAFAMSLFASIPESMRCPPDNIIMLRRREDLDSENNKLVALESFEDGKFKQFIYSDIPVINLTPGKAKDVNTDGFKEMVEAIEALRQEMARDKALYKAETDKMAAQLREAQRRKGACGIL